VQSITLSASLLEAMSASGDAKSSASVLDAIVAALEHVRGYAGP
jgi:hypothetical protein